MSVQAFCETVETAAAVQSAGEDRRLGKAHLKIQMGGMAAAIEAYRTAPTPNVIILETEGRNDILAGLDQLATVCDAGTRVVVIGRVNDVTLYRELVRRGVSDYLIAPVDALDVVRSICGLFSAPEAKAVGRIIAVVGAKGGVGASTIAHNVAWAIARDLALDSVVADLDLAFGTAGLDYNQDPPQGIADAVFSPDRIDTAFIDRLLSKCTDHLSLLAAPATLDRVYDFGAEAFDSIFDTLRTTMPCIVLDVPHQWSGWTKRALVGADDILIVAAPDLANLRNTKNMFDLLKAVAAQRPAAALLPQPGRRAEAAGNQRQRIRQGDREPADRIDSVRAADVRLGRQQRPDDRGNLRQSSHHRDVSADRAAADRPRRDQKAAGFVPVTPAREAAGQVAPHGVPSCLVSVAEQKAIRGLRSPPQRRSRIRAAGGRVARAARARRVLAAARPRRNRRRPRPPIDARRSDTYYQVKATIFGALIEAIDLAQLAKLDGESAREEIRDIVNEIIAIKNIVMSIAEQEELLDDICNDVLGYGPLEPLLSRDDIADIMVNGAGTVFIEVAGKIQKTGIRFRDNQQLLNICQRIVSQVGRRVDESSPICDARLADGSRVNAIVPPLAIDGPALTIRKFKKDKLTLDQLVKFGAITPEGAEILQIIGRCRANVLISGGTGSGKTTLLNCLTQYIDDDERIITCEDAAELQLQQPHVVRLETRPPNIEGEGQVTMRELVRNCLRMRPERIIVGEVRGPEAFDLLQAMNTGHDGSMGTLHANNPREALSRCESMITMGGFSLPSRTIREMICASIDVVIQAARLRDGSRRITHITEVMGMEGDTIITQDLFVYDMVGEDANGNIIGRHRSTGIGRPRFWDRARYYGEEKRLAAALDAAEVVVEV